MPDNVNPGDSPTTPANKVEHVPTDDTGEATISVNDFKELKSTVGKLIATNRNLQNQIKAFTAPAEPKVEDQDDAVPEGKSYKDLYKEANSRLKKLEETDKSRAKELADERRELAIKSSINSFGLDEENADLFEAFLLQKHGSNIKAEGKTVVYEDPETGEKSNVKDFIGGVYKSKADKFKPAQQVPNGRGFKNGSNVPTGKAIKYGEMSAEERAKLTKPQRDALVAAEWKNRS